MLTTFNEIDMTSLLALRGQINKSLEGLNQKIGIMPFFIAAAQKALGKFKIINSYIDGENIVENDFVDISIAVASDKGLVVPVIRNVEGLRLMDIENQIKHYQQKANNGTLELSEMAGGTFTITNGGTFGSLMSTPIINPPQSSILGIHTTKKRPMVIDDQIVVGVLFFNG